MPMAEGVLIFNEVKVISQLMWNSRSQTIVGLAMTTYDQASPHDVYQLFDKDKATDQTLNNAVFMERLDIFLRHCWTTLHQLRNISAKTTHARV